MIHGFDKETEPLTKYEINEVLPPIVKGLKRRVGKENAIPNYKMVKALKEHGIKTSEPRVRKIINHIRQLGIIRNLIASNKGYWVEIDEQERKKYVKGVKARAEAMLAALNHIDI